MNRLEQELNRLSAGQQERVRVAHASYEEGLLTREEFVDLVSAVVLTGNAYGYALGAAMVRSLVEQTTGVPEMTPVVPAPPHLDEGRVAAALATVLASEQDTLMQLARIADNEPKQAATDGSADVILESDRVDGWTRSLDSDACDLCTWWARESPKFPPDRKMPRHPGCVCSQTPVVAR